MFWRLFLQARRPLGFARATTDRRVLALSIWPPLDPSLLSVAAALGAFSTVSHLKTKGISRALAFF